MPQRLILGRGNEKGDVGSGLVCVSYIILMVNVQIQKAVSILVGLSIVNVQIQKAVF